ncbi:TPA: hypothetical protein HH295_07090 [Xanthomonas vasicola pv. zeae]|uniref:Bacteriocin n=1 Tax=Xanthomonas vasicola TaxID=56459 RepID=A0ABD7S4T6_XANVA|nr:hypothetical protein [Xanthomonas vasicola]MDO6954837.1 hypothetical protein [Xanthomonas vasicola]MDO6971403.1 hypothetical protein [Xanthomonas vasicola]OWF62745.1 hypothetical protein B1H32_05365 [Xanthomonas vasicola pv. vasculorum]OWF62932.1 hypothetical protein B1H41_06000 [Xanthomonas vasicola pv. vasculorum]TWQ18299.1 hypothetical protein FQK00_15895 [Xanthomonas vasicola]
MRELTANEIEMVDGGTLAGDIAFTAASGWSAGVMGTGVGLVFGGPVGGIAGGLVGFGIGVGAGIGYILAQPR